jgi:hypothetical protein
MVTRIGFPERARKLTVAKLLGFVASVTWVGDMPQWGVSDMNFRSDCLICLLLYECITCAVWSVGLPW